MGKTAPKIVSFEIPIDKIGEVIGPKGKVINAIQAETGADISVDDDGTVGVVAIASTSSEIVDEAERQIKLILNPPTAEVGQTYTGKVVNITDRGVAVDIVLGVDDLAQVREKFACDYLGQYGGGLIANATVAAARLGRRCGFVGWVGDDEHGRFLREEFAAAEVDTSGLLTVAGATPFTVVVVDARGEHLIALPRTAPPSTSTPACVVRVNSSMFWRVPGPADREATVATISAYSTRVTRDTECTMGIVACPPQVTMLTLASPTCSRRFTGGIT